MTGIYPLRPQPAANDWIEKDPSWDSIFNDSPVRDRIDRTFGPRSWGYHKNSTAKIKRLRMKNKFRRHHARGILGEITGIPWLGFLHESPGKLDERFEWVLERILEAKRGTRKRQFLVAIAKDAGVYPPPKWWRITRRLQGKTKFPTRYHSPK